MISFDEYLEMMNRNLLIMSRTANGIVDVSASKDKVNYIEIKNGEQADLIVFSNTEKAIRKAYENRNKVFTSPSELGDFIIDIVKTVNKGIVKDGLIFRIGSDSEKFHYAKVDDLQYIYNWFCNQLYERINKTNYDYIETACFCEYVINPVAHFFPDGCSKISMIISAYILMRNDSTLPKYRSRDEYYSNLTNLDKKVTARRDLILVENEYNKFLEYYRTLFN